MRLALVAILALLLSGCSAQVTGMQSPVLHDYGTIDWIPVDREIRQPFITGSGYSATIDNDPATTPEEFLERNAALPDDAREGRLDRVRIGLRLSGREDTGWDTGARVQIRAVDGEGGAVVDVAVDELARSGDRVFLTDLPDIPSGSVFEIVVLPGSGPDSDRLQLGITPHRAPYGGWRASTGGDELRGAMVFGTRYERDVALGEVFDEGISRIGNAGIAFLLLYGVAFGGLLLGVVYLAGPARRDVRGGG